MRLFKYLAEKAGEIGEITKLYSNLPESYIKRSYERVFFRNPTGINYRKVEIKKKKFRFTSNRPWTTQFQLQNDPKAHRKKVFLEPVGDWKFFKGDRVEIIVGRDKGKQGIVNQVIQERNWVFVEGLNTHYRRVGKEPGYPGVVIQSEAPLLVTNEVKLVDPETLKPTDIEWRYTEEGEKVRVSLTTSRLIPIPKQAYETKDYKTKQTYVENPKKDTKAKVVSEITFKPVLGTFEMDIMKKMNIKEDRVAVPSYWY